MQNKLNKLIQGETLESQEAAAMLGVIMDSTEVDELQISAILALIEGRGVTRAELKGFRSALLSRGIRVSLGEVIDVCGTGGDRKNTFNISTTAAFVMAGAGCRVAKHGNFSATSKCGSSNVLQSLGIEFSNSESALRSAIERSGICVLHAPLFQPKLGKLGPLRSRLGFRTVFNLLGPLLNPAAPSAQMIGVNDPRTLRIYYGYFYDPEFDEENPGASVSNIGSSARWMLVHSFDGYDEISLTGQFIVRGSFLEEIFYPEDLGFTRCRPSDLVGGETPDENAEILLRVLRCEAEQPKQEVVVANAAFGILASKEGISLEESIKMARSSLESGAAYRAFESLKEGVL